MKNTVLLSMLSTATGKTNEEQYSPVEEILKKQLWLIQTTPFLFLKPITTRWSGRQWRQMTPPIGSNLP